MHKIAIAKANIRAEVAREGRITTIAIRQFVENRMPRKMFDEAVAEGMKLHEAAKRKCDKCGGSKDIHAACQCWCTFNTY